MDGVMPRIDLPMRRYRVKMTGPKLSDGQCPTLSAWRGAFGHGLKELVCSVPEGDCSTCFLQTSCLYPKIFEPRPDPRKKMMVRYNRIPPPYTLFRDPPDENESLSLLTFALFGEANDSLPHILMAFDRAGSLGIGPGRVRYSLDVAFGEKFLGSEDFFLIYQKGMRTAYREFSLEPPSCPSRPYGGNVIVSFLSPLRMRFSENLVTPSDFTFGFFFRNILRRLSLLVAFYGGGPLALDYRTLVHQADQVPLAASDLSWRDWTRFSSRQNVMMQMGGVHGSIVLRATDLDPFWELLWWGQWTGAGKGTTMGNGVYRLILEKDGREEEG